ncbi:MAG: TetR/AcrR family transcriptional regulator, partial [Spongiibacteraceae bacterium]
ALGYEQQKMLTLSVQAMMWQSEVLRKNNARNQRGLRKDLDDWLPELRELDKGRREAIDAVASFETWHRLRETQGLSKKVSIAVLVDTISALMGL